MLSVPAARSRIDRERELIHRRGDRHDQQRDANWILCGLSTVCHWPVCLLTIDSGCA